MPYTEEFEQMYDILHEELGEDLPSEAQTTSQNMSKQEPFKSFEETANEIHKATNPHFDNPVARRDILHGQTEPNPGKKVS